MLDNTKKRPAYLMKQFSSLEFMVVLLLLLLLLLVVDLEVENFKDAIVVDAHIFQQTPRTKKWKTVGTGMAMTIQ